MIFFHMEEGHHHEGEIVLRITPRNLERLIYILIIIGLLIFSIVLFNKDADCPDVECDSTTEDSSDNSATDDTNDDTTTDDNGDSGTTDTGDDGTTTPSLSGEVEFTLTSVKTCIENETLDKGMFDSVTVSIDNGLSRMLSARIDIYMWDTGSLNEIEDLATRIEDIKVLSGATMTHTYYVDLNEFTSKGRFLDISGNKKVKAVLVDTDLNTEIDEKIITGIKATEDCE